MELLRQYEPRCDKLVVFRARPGCGGLGDRVVGLLSACVLALVTQRRFRIAWQSPIALRSMWRPVNRKIAWDAHDWDEPGSAVLSLIDCAQIAKGLFQTDDILNQLPDRLLIEANQHFFTEILQNPYVASSADAGKLPDAATLSQKLLELLFQPTEVLSRALAPYRKRMAGRRWLGVQIRTLWNWQDGGGRLDQADLERFGDCARSRLDAGAVDGLFATADDPAAIEFLCRAVAPREVVFVPGTIPHHDRSDDCDPGDHLSTFVNLQLLSDCHELLISQWSNFGRLAALWAGRVPWVTRKSFGSSPLEVADEYRQARLTELVSKESSEALVLGGQS